MTTTDEINLPEVPTVSCDHCGTTVPDSQFCGACGADLAASKFNKAPRRLGSYAAFPDEPTLRVSLVTSLFPQLASRSKVPFRMAFSVFVVVLISLALARLEPAVIAVSALGIPLLFVCYVAEIEPMERRFVLPATEVFLAGAALGVSFALLFGPMVSDALEPLYSTSLTSTTALRSALLAPVIAQLLMVLPIALLRLRRPLHTEALDGFTAGAMGGLGLTTALTLTELAPQVQDGNVMHGSVLIVLSSAIIRGLTLPIVAAATTGYLGATLWNRVDRDSRVKGSWLASPPVALGFALLLMVGLGFADDAGLSDAFLVVVHLFAAIVALSVLRVGLHHVLLHEQRDVRIGNGRLCPNCLHNVPAMPFCPNCGIAERATPLLPLPLRRARGVSGEDSVTGGGSNGDLRRRAEATPTSSTGHRAANFARGSDEQLQGHRQLGSRRLLLVMLGGLAIGIGIFVALAVVVPTKPAVPCISLRCFTLYGPIPVRNGNTYTSAQGWGVNWFPAREVFNSPVPVVTSATSTANELQLVFTSPAAAEDGELVFTGAPAEGQTASQLVTALQQANVSNATPDYVLPGATVGYELGYGEAFVSTPNSAEGDDRTYEVVINCAVVNDYGVCTFAEGPRFPVSALVNHPTPSQLVLSLWSDPDVNSVFWHDNPTF